MYAHARGLQAARLGTLRCNPDEDALGQRIGTLLTLNADM